MVKPKKITISIKRQQREAKRLEFTRRFHLKQSPAKIAADMNVCEKTVNCWLKKWLAGNGISDEKKSGRPKKLSSGQVRQIVNAIPENGITTAESLRKKANLNTRVINRKGKEEDLISRRTVCRVLKEEGFNARKVEFEPFLTDPHMKARVDWALKYSHWTVEQWKKVGFSDESTFKSNTYSPTHQYVKGQKTAKHIVHRDKSARFKVNLFGVISGNGKVFLKHVGKVNGEKYLKTVQEGDEFIICFSYQFTNYKNQQLILFYILVVPLFKKNTPDGIWQQDGLTSHTVPPVLEYLNKTVTLLEWPSKSPDISIIENIWGIMKSRLSEMNLDIGEVQSASQLEDRMHSIWDSIDSSVIDKLYNSLPGRIQDVIKSGGSSIDY